MRPQELTEDILAGQSADVQSKFAEMFGGAQEDEDGEPIRVISLVNANCKGYCRVKLDRHSAEYFQEHLSSIDTVNRCYLWRILFDHVRLLKISPQDFLTAVNAHLLQESETQIIEFIIEKVNWIVDNGLVENSPDPNFNEYAANLTKDTIAGTYIDKLRNLDNQAEKTLLITNYLKLLRADEEAHFGKLIEMARSATLSHENDTALA